MSAATPSGRPPPVQQTVALEVIQRAHRLLEAFAEGDSDTLLQIQGLPDSRTAQDLSAVVLGQQEMLLALLLTTHVATRELAATRGLEQSQIREYVLWFVERANAHREAGV